MNETERLESVERRIDLLSLRLASIEAQLRRLEGHTEVPAPPPVLFEPPAPAAPIQREAWVRQAPLEPEVGAGVPPSIPKQKEDMEYRLGSKGLLWAGALVSVLGLLYLVALAIARGYISPTIQFAGEIALCLGFIAFGFSKREMREDFGNLLMGVGSCGVFLSLAGAHVYKGIIGGEALVGLFMIWSLLNLAFSWWKESRAFWGIGLLGGLVAAALPLREHHVVLACAMHLVIVVPAVIIAGRGRWSELLVGGWALSLMALLPLYFEPAHWPLRLGELYVSSLLWAVAYAVRSEKTAFDPWQVFPAVAVIVAGSIGFGARSGLDAATHIGLLAAASAGAGLVLRRDRLTLAGALVAVLFIPFAWRLLTAEAIEIVLAIGLAGLSMKWNPRACLGLGLVALSLAMGVHVSLSTGAAVPTWQSESVLLAGLMLAVTVCGFATYRLSPRAETVAVIGALIGLPMIGRLTWVALARPELGWAEQLPMSLLFIGYGTAVAVVGGLRRWPSAITLGWLSLAVGLAVYSSAADGARLSLGSELLVVSFAIVASLASAYSTSKATGATQVLAFGVSALVLTLLVRMGYVVLTMAVRWPSDPVKFVMLLGAAAVAAVVGQWRERAELSALGALFLLTTAIPYFASYGKVGFGFEGCFLLGSLVVLVLLGEAAAKTKEAEVLTGASVIAAWPVWTRLMVVTLGLPFFSIKAVGAVTAAWIVYALALIALGFTLDRRVLRLGGLAVFGVTVGKVLLVDLADVDPAVRVVLLLALGMAMIGGAYWYIRSRRGKL